MKTAPFDLDKALAGHPLVTRDGKLAIGFRQRDPEYPLNWDRETYPYSLGERSYGADGRCSAQGESPGDLFLLLETPSRQQVGGAHYKSLPIQPAEYCQRNKLTWCEANVVKYVTRHREKNGRQDIEKAIHYLELLLELEYPTEQKP
jgi:hypothetical protein